MTRPAGVTVSAVVVILGSIVALFFAAMFLFAAATQAPPAGMPGFRGFAVAMAIFVAGLAALGILTAVGLLRLRPWARTSVLVFAGVMAAFTLAGGLATTLMPVPPELTGEAATALKPILLVMYAVPFGIGVWWLIQFNTTATRAAFAGVTETEPSTRPLIISVIGWFNVVAGVGSIAAGVMGSAAFVAGAVLTGWGAVLYYVFLGAVNSFLGWRLLQLDERARVLTIWWFALSIAHLAFLALTPPVRARLMEYQRSVTPADAPAPLDPAGFTIGMLAFAMVILGAAIWPLITSRSAFEQPEQPEQP